MNLKQEFEERFKNHRWDDDEDYYDIDATSISKWLTETQLKINNIITERDKLRNENRALMLLKNMLIYSEETQRYYINKETVEDTHDLNKILNHK